MAVSLQQLAQLRLGDSREHSRVGDLVAVEVQDREHRSVSRRVDELVGVPARGERTCLRLAVADNAEDREARVVEGRAVRVHERVAELAALVNRARRLGRVVARYAARERELPEQLAQPGLVHGHVGVALGVRAFEVGVRHAGGAAVSRAHDVDRVELTLLDDAVGVRVDEVEAGRRAPVAEQARLDVLELQGTLQERVVEQVDLAGRQEVRRAPVGVDEAQLRRFERLSLVNLRRGGCPGLRHPCTSS